MKGNSLSKTPSPIKDRIFGSKTNKKGSAASKYTAKGIQFSSSVITTLENKKDEYNAKHPNNKVTLATLKAVFRRGAGAYSNSHRPNITRSGWAFARVNKFLLKKGGTKVKAAYVQDDDLMERGGEIVNYLIHWTNRNGLDGILSDNTLNEESSLTDSLKLTFDKENNMPFGIKFKNISRNLLIKKGVTLLEKKHEYRLKKDLKVDYYFDGFVVRNNTNKNRLEKYLENSFGFWNNDKYSKYYKENDGYGILVSGNYVQDDDFMERGAILNSSCKTYISQNESVLKTGYYLNLSDFSSMVDPYGQIPLNLTHTLVTYNSGNQDGLSLINTINPINLQNELADILNIPINKAQVVVGLYIEMAKKLKSISEIEGDNIIVIDRDNVVCKSENNIKLMERGALLAPNLNPSNLTPEQYKLVRTPEFKAWFGDWENNPESASKVVDENGEPLVVYHGTNVKEQFNIFDFDKADLGFHFGTYQQANDRSETKIGIKGYKKIITSYFLNIRKLFSITDIGEFYYPQRYLNELLSDNLITEKEAKENGFFNAYYKEDNKVIRNFLVKKYKNIGFEYNNQYEGKGKSFIALHNNQMKLADGTNTTFDGDNPDIRYEEGGLLAPNLQPSNLTYEQWHLVRTPEFKSWFGDWEKHPESASKVVDDNGEPLVVYHGGRIFNEFKKGEGVDKGIYFTNNKYFAQDVFAKQVEVYERDKKNYYYDDIPNDMLESDEWEEEYFKYSKIYKVFLYILNPIVYESLDAKDIPKLYNKKNDGVIVGSTGDFGYSGNQIVVFEPTQIKLADGTNTTFDGDNPDIRYELGGIFHGSSYWFDKFKIEKIGSGIGQQNSGWGLYLTDDKEAAKKFGDYIYETTLFKGKKFDEYNFIDLDKPINIDLLNKIIHSLYELKKVRYITFNDYDLKEFDYSGYLFYKTLSRILGGDKKASLFLLDNGIDGLRKSFKHHSDEDDTHDYIIFDDKDITIENIKHLPYNYYLNGGDVDKKSDGTNTTFDGNNPDIRYEQGGWINKTDIHGKYIVWDDGDFYIAVDDLEDARYITLWRYGVDGKIGFLNSNLSSMGAYHGKDGKWLSVQSIDIQNKYRGLGFSKKLYQALLNFSRNDIKGIFSYLPNRVNKKQIPKIYNRFNSEIIGDYQFIEKEKNIGKYKQGGLIAPNGEKSNLTPEQYKLVRTPEFKAWFGDWEKHPENASRVVDNNGEPLICYHSTEEKFNIFSYEKMDTSSNYYDIIGFYFTLVKPNKKTPYGNITKSCFLNIRKPIFVTNDIVEKNPSWGTKSLTKNQILSLIGDREQIDNEHGEGNVGLQNILNILTYQTDTNSQNINSQLQFIYKNFFSKWRVKDGIKLHLKNITDILGYDGATMPHSNYVVAFHPNQIKLADGTNTTFDADNPDIRFANGGTIPNDLSKLPYFDKGHDGAEYWSYPEHGDGRKLQKSERWYELMFKHQKERIKLTKEELEEFENLSYELEIDDYEDGGETDDYNVIIYHEKQGNWVFAKNTIYAWVYEKGSDASSKLSSGEYDWVLFPPSVGMYMAFSKGYIPPLKKVWTKKFQQNHKGSEKLLGIVKAYYDEQENKLYIMMMTTRKDVRRKGINSLIVKTIREKFNLEKDQVVFDDPTKEGTKFMNSGKFVQGGLIAPNGNTSNLTPEQYKLVRTPEFKAWFGDWEKHPESASQVVDKNGEPLVVYHGTNAKFTIFDTDEESQSRNGGTWNAEYPDGYIFMISNKNEAKYYGKRIIPLFVNLRYPTIKKVKIGDSLILPFDDYGLAFEGDAIVTDGINYVVGTQDEYAVKLADGSNTTFDGNNPDIRYEKGGEVKDLVVLHNINSNQIKEANYVGGLITPSIAILKAGEIFTDFGSITLMATKELINPENSYLKVFSGDVYSPSVPRKLYNVDKKKLDKITTELISKSYKYGEGNTKADREIYTLVQRYIGDYSDFSKELNRRDYNDLIKNYYEDLKIVYIVDNSISIKVPMKEKRHFLFNNMEFSLTQQQKKRFAPILSQYMQESNEKGSNGVSNEIQSKVYDLFLEVLDNIKLEIKIKYNGDQILYDIMTNSLDKSFEKYVGTRYDWGGYAEYNLSKAVYGQQELDKDKLNSNINKIFTKTVKLDYEKWLFDFITQFRGSAYFLKGNQKMPYTIDYLVGATSNGIRGQEESMTFGVNKAKSYSLKQFKNIDEIKKKSSVLISKKEMGVIDKKNQDEFFNLSEELRYKYSDTWDRLDSLGKALADYFKGASSISALTKNDFKTPYLYELELFEEFAENLKNSPVDYFEAKHQRAVKLNEFKYAIVPKSTDKETIDILKNNGLIVKKYETNEDRVEIINNIAEKDKSIKFKEGGFFNLGGLLAPNGEPSNLTPEQYKLVRTPEFKAWFGDWEKNPENSSKVVDENGEPKVVFHGTTHEFYTFTKIRGNAENHFGLGYYFTDSKIDVENNYLKEGADITNRIEQYKDIIEQKLQDDYIEYSDLVEDIENVIKNYNVSIEEIEAANDFDELAKIISTNKLIGGKEIIITAFLAFFNPIDLTSKKAVYDSLYYENEDGDYVEDKDSLPMKLYDAMNNIAYDFEEVNTQKIWNDIWNSIYDDWDGVSFYKVDALMRKSEGLIYATDENGNLSSNEYIRSVYERMGFDGIIMDADLEFGNRRKYGTKMKMDIGTKHYIGFEPNQIKLANGSNTTFDAENPDIRYEQGGLSDIKKDEKTTTKNCLIAQNYSDAAKGIEIYPNELHYQEIEKIRLNKYISYYDIQKRLYWRKADYIKKAIKSAKTEKIPIFYCTIEEAIYFEFDFGQVSFHIDESYVNYPNVNKVEYYQWSGLKNTRELLKNNYK